MFDKALLVAGIVSLDAALQRTAALSDPAEAHRARRWIERLASSLPQR